MYSTLHEVAKAALRFADHLDPPGRRFLFDPRNMLRAGLMFARHGAESIEGALRGRDGKVALAELDNRMRAFRLFETVSSNLEAKPDELDIAAAINRAEARFGRQGAVWASEGIGHVLGSRLLAARGRSSDRLPSLPTVGPPGLPGVWAVLHTGAGMALAEHFLKDLKAESAVQEGLRSHIEACEQLAKPGESAMVFEPLGLVVRLLRPDLLRPVHRELSRMQGAWADLFWHGVGRGVYFLPADLSPRRSAPWRGWARCGQETPTPDALRNARAGFAWAVTLVNLETPSVMEVFLSHHGRDHAPVGNGIASALHFWKLLTGGSRSYRRFLAHVAPAPRRELWKRFVAQSSGGSEHASIPSWGDLYRFREA